MALSPSKQRDKDAKSMRPPASDDQDRVRFMVQQMESDGGVVMFLGERCSHRLSVMFLRRPRWERPPTPVASRERPQFPEIWEHRNQQQNYSPYTCRIIRFGFLVVVYIQVVCARSNRYQVMRLCIVYPSSINALRLRHGYMCKK